MRTNKIILLIVFCFIFKAVAFAQSKEKLKGKPETLEETYKYLNQIFDDTAKFGFMTMPEREAVSRLHFGLGLWIRNNWGLWKGGKLSKYFVERGITHPDDMSGTILTSYHRYLNYNPPYIMRDGKLTDTTTSVTPIELGLQDIIQNKSDTVPLPNPIYTRQNILLKLFPVGDTILTTVSAITKKMFQTQYAGARTIAIVKEHRNDKLVLQIISIHNQPKEKVDKQVGDMIEQQPYYCWQLPPKGWKSRDAGK